MARKYKVGDTVVILAKITEVRKDEEDKWDLDYVVELADKDLVEIDEDQISSLFNDRSYKIEKTEK